ncbi:MAG TPA: glycosyltransferase WbuB, partial [Anaerolineales bacterium]|nr:glycosyltransferase WbuB [Anaerolineales bacterium]
GRPVVLAIDGVIREVVEVAGCGIFAAPGSADEVANAIRKLAADKKESRIMGLQGRDYLQKNFSRAAIGEKLLGLLEDLRSK